MPHRPCPYCSGYANEGAAAHDPSCVSLGHSTHRNEQLWVPVDGCPGCERELDMLSDKPQILYRGRSMKDLADWPTVTEDDATSVVIEDWWTPLTDAAAERRKVGDARLVNEPYTRGVYSLENVGGIDFYMTHRRMPVAALQRRGADRLWKTWMVDDPLHWYAMRERVMAMPAGNIVCAGLGLGLMLWHLVERSDIRSILVIELDQDVVRLMTPLIPQDSRISVEVDDYYRWLDAARTGHWEAPDAILWDLAVGHPEQTRDDLLFGKVTTKYVFPDVPLFRFGVKRVEGE